MSEIPADVMVTAGETIKPWTIDDGTTHQFEECAKAVARAIMAERYRCANVGYRVCAETRHVKLGMQVKEAIRRGN